MRRTFLQTRPAANRSGRRNRRRGAIIILSAFVLIVILVFSALVIDYGLMTIAAAQVQNAADAGAHAGVAELYALDSQFTPIEALGTAQEYVERNPVLGEPAANVEVRIGRVLPNYTHTDQFFVSFFNANSVEVTCEATVPLVFARLFGEQFATVSATAVATITPLDRTELIPLALRAPGFGPVDPGIAEVNPGKDGPSMPANGFFFDVGDAVTLFVFGKGKKPDVHLALGKDLINPSDAFKILEGDDPPIRVSRDDEFLVFNEGTGSNSFGIHLATRLDFPVDDPMRTVIVPIVELTDGGRNGDGQIDGFVRVVDFAAVHLDAVVPDTVDDPTKPGRTIDIELLVGTVVRKNVKPDLVRPGTIFSPTEDISAFSIRLTH